MKFVVDAQLPARLARQLSDAGHDAVRLLIVATGNISNDDPLALFDQHLDSIVSALGEVRFVELGPDRLIVHEDR